MSEIEKRRLKILRNKLFSNIKIRSKSHNVRNEITADLEKISLKPEELLLFDYI